MHRRYRVGSKGIGALALGAFVALFAACQDTGSTTPTTSGSGGGHGGGAPAGVYLPQGCQFAIRTRPEYLEFAPGTPVSAPAPNIRRVRLGLGGNVAVGAPGRADPSTSVGVAWQTDDGTLASDIQWGVGPDPASWPAGNRATGVTWKTPEGSLNPQGEERMHEVHVCGLSPSTTYHYRVGGGAAGKEVWSEVHAFATTPPAGPSKVTIAVTGDSRGQQDNAWQILQRRVAALGATFQLFSGDMINLAPDQGEWEQWLDRAWKDGDQKLLTLGQLLTLSAHGNHDNHTTLFFGNLVLPQDDKKYPKYGELFFSVDIGPVHVMVIDDAWIVSPTGDPEYKGVLQAWLEEDLQKATQNRSTVPWIVAMHHHPEYSSSTHGNDADVLRGRAFFGPIWDKHHVDLAISGHDHNYERSKPITGPTDSPTVQSSFADGTVYLVCAGSGADSYSAGTSTFTEVSHDFKGGGALGLYAILTADASSLKIEGHELRADGSDPVFDSVTIPKP